MSQPCIRATVQCGKGSASGCTPSLKGLTYVKDSHSILHAGDADFDSVVLGSPRLVIADFWAPWCPPCRILAPFLVKFAAEYGDRISVVKINRDESPGLRERFDVQTIPRLLFFNAGELADTKIGLPDYPVLKQWIDDAIASITGGEKPGESAAETRFAQTVVDADAVYEREIGPAHEAFNAAAQAVMAAFTPAIEAATAALEAHEIDQDEFDRRKGAAEAKRDEDITPARAAYKAVNGPLEAAYIATVQAAAEQFAADLAAASGFGIGSTSCTGCGSDYCSGCDRGCSSGKVCQIGDPNCQS